MQTLMQMQMVNFSHHYHPGVRQDMAAGMSEVGTKFLSQLENGKETAELGKTLRASRYLPRYLLQFPDERFSIKL